MPRILILYGTTDGHTAKVAAALARTLRLEGAVVTVADAGGPEPAPGPETFTAVIVAASVHAGGYQETVRRWVRQHLDALVPRPTAFVSVCLGVLQRDPAAAAELQAIYSRFVGDTGWRPGTMKMVAGALLYTHYGWLKRWMMRRIAAKAHGDVDTSRDYEYTDWADLQGFARDFLAAVRRPRLTPAPEALTA